MISIAIRIGSRAVPGVTSQRNLRNLQSTIASNQTIESYSSRAASPGLARAHTLVSACTHTAILSVSELSLLVKL